MGSALHDPTGIKSINTDILFEDFFLISTVRKHELAHRIMGEPMPITLRRWARRGKKSPITKEIIYLEVAVSTEGLVTSLEACRRFLERLNGVLAPQKIAKVRLHSVKD